MTKESQVNVSVPAKNPFNEDMIKTSKKRYLILLILMLLIIVTSFQSLFIASINDFMATYYGISHLAINLVNIISMTLNLVLMLPITWTMERVGLRTSVLIGSLCATGNMLIKCLSYHPSGFIYNLLASIFAVGQLFFVGTFPRVVVVWFPERQLSRAIAMSAVASEIGYALGYLIPSYLVGPDPEDTEYVEKALLFFYGTGSAILASITLLIVFVFDEQPDYAPSIARFKQMKIEREEKFDTLLSHMKNQLKILQSFFADKNFCLLFAAYGAIEGVNYSFHVVLNQMIGQMHSAQSTEKLVSNVGLILIITGLIGSIICGYLLDKYQRFKLTTISVYVWTIVTLFLFIGSLQTGDPIAVCVSSALIGLSITGYMTIACRYASELTYPKPELVSATLLFLAAHLFGIPISLVASILIDNFGFIVLGFAYLVILSFGLLSECLQNGELKRQKSQDDKPDPTAISTAL